jgi:hypothetical protein
MTTNIFYDQACKLLATIMAPGDALNVQYLFRGANGALFIVDRFHFIHYSPLDANCRTNCNPYSPDNLGMVHVHRRTAVIDVGPDPLVHNGIGKNVRRVIQVHGQPKMVHRRLLRRKEPVAGSGNWFEYECEDMIGRCKFNR